MKGKITFNKSGSGSKSARLTIPSVLIELLKITEEEREVDINFADGKLIIEKLKFNKGRINNMHKEKLTQKEIEAIEASMRPNDNDGYERDDAIEDMIPE